MSLCDENDVLELVQGDDWTILATLRLKKSKAPADDISSATEITAKFKKIDGTYLTKTLSGYVSGSGIQIISGPGAKISIQVPKTESVNIKDESLVTIPIVVTLAGKEKTYKVKKGITIEKR